MSSVRDPAQKKRLSYLRDRRLDGFDNPHGARLAIPRNKRRANKANRLAVSGALAQVHSVDDVDDVVEIALRKRSVRWKKVPDTPLACKVVDRSDLARHLIESRNGKR